MNTAPIAQGANDKHGDGNCAPARTGGRGSTSPNRCHDRCRTGNVTQSVKLAEADARRYSFRTQVGRSCCRTRHHQYHSDVLLCAPRCHTCTAHGLVTSDIFAVANNNGGNVLVFSTPKSTRLGFCSSRHKSSQTFRCETNVARVIARVVVRWVCSETSETD